MTEAFERGHPIVAVSDLSVRIGDRVILDDVAAEVHAGEVVAVLGMSGSGKTTLLSCLAGLRQPTTGSIEVLGHDMSSLSAARRARLRLNSIGFVFQHADLLPELTPLENVTLPAILAGSPVTDALAAGERLVDELGVRTTAGTEALSGGEAQRLALARAVITGPSLLLADEPTGSLDAATRDDVLGLMLGLIRSRGMAAIVATHDSVVAEHADRVMSLSPADLSSVG